MMPTPNISSADASNAARNNPGVRSAEPSPAHSAVAWGAILAGAAAAAALSLILLILGTGLGCLQLWRAPPARHLLRC